MKRSHSDAFLLDLPISEGTDSNSSYGDSYETSDMGELSSLPDSGSDDDQAATDNHQAATDNFQALVDAYHEHNRQAVADVAKHDAVGPWDERWWWKGGDTVPQQNK